MIIADKLNRQRAVRFHQDGRITTCEALGVVEISDIGLNKGLAKGPDKWLSKSGFNLVSEKVLKEYEAKKASAPVEPLVVPPIDGDDKETVPPIDVDDDANGEGTEPPVAPVILTDDVVGNEEASVAEGFNINTVDDIGVLRDFAKSKGFKISGRITNVDTFKEKLKQELSEEGEK